MKMFKKALAAVIAVIMIFSVVSVSAYAAPDAPLFTYSVKSQTSSTVTLEFSLKSGSFNSLDIEFVTSGNIGACSKISTTAEFDKIRNQYSNEGSVIAAVANPKTAMFSLASTKTFNKPTSILEVIFAKKSSANVTSESFGVSVVNCVITVGSNNHDVTSSTKTVRGDMGYIEFDTDSISANYKASKKINYTSSYSAKQIKWESSNTKVATVDEEGNVKMTGKGTATITATSTDGIASAQCKVTVNYSFGQWLIIIVLFGWIWYI